MRPNSKKRSANRSGAVLVTAVAVLLVMSILMTATVGYVSQNRTKTNSNYSHKQAYLVASTTLKSFVDQIYEDTNKATDQTAKLAAKAKINALKSLAAANGGKGTTTDVKFNGETNPGYRIGTTKLNIAQDHGSESNLVITAYTTYAGKTEKVAAHISTDSKTRPADFTNTIEVHGNGAAHWDNLNVIGDTAIVNQNTEINYEFGNKTNYQGSYVFFGSVNPGTGHGATPVFNLKPNIISKTKGTFAQISGNYTGEMWAKSLMPNPGDGTYNYIFINGTSKFHGGSHTPTVGDSATNAVDLITHEIDISQNDYSQYGNIYCYKGGGKSGDAWFHGTNPKINGDLYVEGNLKCDSALSVTGKVVVGGTITGSCTASGGTEEGHTNFSDIKTGRGSEPDMKASYDKNVYKFFPEDFMMNNPKLSSSTSVSNFASIYQSFYNDDGETLKSGVKRFDSLAAENITTSDGATFRYHITEPIVMDTTTITNRTDMFGNGYGHFLVDVDDSTKDQVILLKNDSTKLENKCVIVVRNRSSMVEQKDDEGNVISVDRKYNCYFASDSGKKITLGWNDVAGISTHTGSKECTIDWGNGVKVYDYDTYIEMYKGMNVYNKADGKYGFSFDTAEPRSGFIFNPSGEEVEGAFKPTTANIMFLLGEKTKFVSSNGTAFQAVIYGPNADFLIHTNGISNATVCDSNGNTSTSSGIKLLGMGVFIANSFKSDNESFYCYTRPSGTSLLSLSKGNDSDTLNGFRLDRFDHY